MLSKIKGLISDQASANIFLFCIVLYLSVVGYFRITSTFVVFSPQFLLMLIPILATDALKTAIECFSTKKFIKAQEDLSKVTVIIPCHNGADNLSLTLKSLLRRFKPSQIYVSSDASTDKTCQTVKKFGVRLVENKINIGKVAAINICLKHIKTPYTLILDDDTLLDEAIVPTNALDQGYDAVAFRVLPVIEGALSKIQLYEYRKSMDVGRNYHNHSASVQNVSGAIGLFKTSELRRQVNIHTGEFSGEDLQRTLLVHLSSKPNGVVISESIVRTFVPTTFLGLYRQRVFGWYPGFLSNFDRYLKLLFRQRTSLRLRIEALYNTLFLAVLDPVRLLLLPILLFTPSYFAFFYLIYVLLELIPYFSTGRHDPFWVVLIYPFYGLFNLLTRILSSVVFIYRRLAVTLAKADKLDDYKIVGLPEKASSIFLSSLTVLLISLIVGIGLAGVSGFKNEVVSIHKIDNVNEQVASIKMSLPQEFIYKAKKGDSLWLLSNQAVREYTEYLGVEIVNQKEMAYTFYIASSKRGLRIYPDVDYNFETESLEKVFASL